MLQRNARFRTSAIAMHCNAHELRCSTNFMSMSPANNVNLTARSSAKVQPFPPKPVVIASLQTAATFSRNDFCLIFIKLGKSFAISFTPYFVGSVVMVVISNQIEPFVSIMRCRAPSKARMWFRKFQVPSSKIQRNTKIQHSTRYARRFEAHLGVGRRLFSKYARKNEVQFFRFAIKFPSFCGKGRFRGGNHPKKMFCFLRFLNAAADGISEILFRDALVCFAIVRANARAAANKLIDQAIICRIARNLPRKSHDCFTECRGALL